MTPLGMIQVTGGVNNRDCYFYMSEVGLEPPTAEPASCPTAAVGQKSIRIAGTRGMGESCSK